MVTIQDLPVELVRRIFQYAILDDNNHAPLWGDLQKYLHLSSSWLTAAYDIVYSSLFCNFTTGRVSFKNMHSVGEENAPRAIRREDIVKHPKATSIFRYVRQFEIQDNIGSNILHPLLCMMEFLDIKPLPPHDIFWFRELSNPDIPNQTNQRTIEAHCQRIVANVARDIAQILANVRNLSIISTTRNDILNGFFSALIFQYAKQLKKLHCLLHGQVPNLSRLTMLTQLSMTILDQEQHVPHSIIFPSSLEHVELHMKDTQFNWHIFNNAYAPGTAVFTHLKTLLLCGDVGYFYEQPIEHELELELAFPALESLDINFIHLNGSHIRALLQAPLRKLTFTGHSETALQLSAAKFDGLDELSLIFIDELEPSHEQFVHNTNLIFARTESVRFVQCVLMWTSARLSFCSINWPFVTELRVLGGFVFFSLFERLLTMGRLRMLFLDMEEVSIFDMLIARVHVRRSKDLLSMIAPCNIEAVYCDFQHQPSRGLLVVIPNDSTWMDAVNMLITNAISQCR